jgi:capsular polysaccharide transport system permease protein
MVRDILNKHGQGELGYVGMVLEPLVWIASIDLAWHLKGHSVKDGISLESFLISGLGAYFLFYAHVLVTVSSSVTNNTNLLYFRRVTPLVLIVASVLREFLTSMIVYVTVIGGLSLYQNNLQLADPLKLLVVLAGISLLAAIGGVLFGLGQLVIPWLRLVQLVYIRIMFIFSGGFFFANDLPPQIAYYASFNPLLDLIEFLRESFYAQYQSHYATWQYPLSFIAVGLVLILVLERTTRRYLVTA